MWSNRVDRKQDKNKSGVLKRTRQVRIGAPFCFVKQASLKIKALCRVYNQEFDSRETKIEFYFKTSSSKMLIILQMVGKYSIIFYIKVLFVDTFLQ